MNVLQALEQRTKMERQIILLEEAIFNQARNEDPINAELLNEIVAELQQKIEYTNKVLASLNYPADKFKHGDWDPAG